MAPRPVVCTTTLLLLLATAGCGRVREINACRSLSREVNLALTEIETLSKRPGARDELGMAKRYAALAKSIKARSAGAAPLDAALRDYASIFEATDAALRAHEEATRTNQPARAADKKRELERLVKRERLAVTRIEAECQS